MLEEILKRLPNWLISIALILIAVIVMVQRFGFGQPIYANGVILPSKEILEAATMSGATHETMERVSAALPDLRERIDSLEQRQTDDFEPIARRVERLETKQQGSAEFIKDAVLAFDHPEGCPMGWSEFTEGRGRFILGVNGSDYRLPYVGGRPDYQTGGEAEVVLTLAEMPTHKHGTYSRDSLRLHDDGDYESFGPGNGAYYNEIEFVDDAVSEEGGSEPHNNMPPYIALYFCKYEGKKNT